MMISAQTEKGILGLIFFYYEGLLTRVICRFLTHRRQKKIGLQAYAIELRQVI